MADTWGDPAKAASNLPGAAHSEPASDGISVWGALSSETRVLVDGVEIPGLLHLGGLRSAVETNLVGRLDLRLTLLVLGAAERVRPSEEITDRRLADPMTGNDWLLQRDRSWYRIAATYTHEGKNQTVLMPFVGWTDDDVGLAGWSNPLVFQHLRSFQYGGRASRNVWLAETAVLTLSLDAQVTRTRASQQGDILAAPSRPTSWVLAGSSDRAGGPGSCRALGCGVAILSRPGFCDET
jgi:hypothetical protein